MSVSTCNIDFWSGSIEIRADEGRVVEGPFYDRLDLAGGINHPDSVCIFIFVRIQ